MFFYTDKHMHKFQQYLASTHFLFCSSEFTTHTHQNVTPVPVVYRGWYLSGCSFIHNATFVTPFVGLAHGSSIKWSTPVSQTAASGLGHRRPMSPTM